LRPTVLLAAPIALALVPAPALADAPRPASVLVIPAHHSGPSAFTLVSVTNTNSTGISTRALFRYVNVVPNPQSALLPLECKTVYRTEHLTPADTITVLTQCHNAGPSANGYLVISAQSPTSGVAWSHNDLVGSATVITGGGGLYTVAAIPFEAVAAPGAPTDVDMDGKLDFDGIEYEKLPDDLHLDSFLGLAGSHLALANFAGDPEAVVSVLILVWNDNEHALSAQLTFRCWFDVPLPSLSNVFTESFLAQNTPNDPNEVDVDCNGLDDLESGWARIRGLSASTGLGTIVNPPLLGAVTGGDGAFECGRPLWGSRLLSAGEF
jgi:hypothetical protein